MRRLSLLLLLALLPLAACDSDDVDSAACAAAGITSTGTMTATAAGEGFTAACVRASLSNGVLSVAGIENVTGATGANQRQINLIVPGAAVGSSTASFGTSYADVDLSDPTTGTYAATGGTITLDALSSTGASGSFSFSARNNGGQTVQVSSGAFDVTF